MAPSLLIADGTAFHTYLAHDRKLLKQSAAILDAAITSITNAQPNLQRIGKDRSARTDVAWNERVGARSVLANW